jgi:hypothetical protein
MSPKKNNDAADQTPAKAAKPATSKPDQMEPEVLEFIQAIDDYKRIHGRPFPSWSEVLEIIRNLGYERADA